MQTFNMNSIRSCLLALTVILCQFYLTNGQFGHHSGGIGQFGGGGFNRRGFGSGGFGGGGGHSFGGGGGHGFGGGASIDHREMRGGVIKFGEIESDHIGFRNADGSQARYASPYDEPHIASYAPAPVPSYSPSVPCPSNILIGCQPQVQTVPCAPQSYGQPGRY